LCRPHCNDIAEAALEQCDARVRRLAAILRDAPEEPGRLLDDLGCWGDALRWLDATARPAPRPLIARLADHHAALWQLLEQWLDAADDAAPRAEQQFLDKAKQTRLIWRARLEEDGFYAGSATVRSADRAGPAAA